MCHCCKAQLNHNLAYFRDFCLQRFHGRAQLVTMDPENIVREKSLLCPERKHARGRLIFLRLLQEVKATTQFHTNV